MNSDGSEQSVPLSQTSTRWIDVLLRESLRLQSQRDMSLIFVQNRSSGALSNLANSTKGTKVEKRDWSPVNRA